MGRHRMEGNRSVRRPSTSTGTRRARRYERGAGERDAAFTLAVIAVGVLATVITIMVLWELVVAVPVMIFVALLVAVVVFGTVVGAAVLQRLNAQPNGYGDQPPVVQPKVRRRHAA